MSPEKCLWAGIGRGMKFKAWDAQGRGWGRHRMEFFRWPDWAASWMGHLFTALEWKWLMWCLIPNAWHRKFLIFKWIDCFEGEKEEQHRTGKTVSSFLVLWSLKDTWLVGYVHKALKFGFCNPPGISGGWNWWGWDYLGQADRVSKSLKSYQHL